MTATPDRPAARSAARPGVLADPGEDDRLPDAELVRRIAAGDAPALEEVYGRYGRACWSLAKRVLGDDALAQDVVQEVFLVLWRDAGRFDAARGGFSSWLLSMTHHKAVDCVRREENLRKRHGAAELLEQAEPPAPAPHDQVWSAVAGEQVRAELQALPEAQREALVLAYFGGYTQREIAGLTSTPLGTVKTRMLAGMLRMRQNLEGLTAEPVADGAS